MFNFFVNNTNKIDNLYYIEGDDFNHVKNVLRMKIGDTLLVSEGGKSSLCMIEEFADDKVIAKILKEDYQDTNLPIEIYLFQGLPKADKFELIIQKAVELGAHKIIPVEMSRSVVKIEDKKKSSKVDRWQAIAEAAAKQSKCSSVPNIGDVTPFKLAVKQASELDVILVPYECQDGMTSTVNALKEVKCGQKVGIFIGPEGGFDDNEIAMLVEFGGKTISLGKRILRTETAAIASITMLMLYAEVNFGDK